jgi:hypothetical protein
MRDICALSGVPKDLCGLYSALVDADDQEDTQALTRLGWVLFSEASTAQDAHHEAVGLLTELRAAACAVIAGEGSPASLSLLREVLATRGWLPPPNATPLQVLAAPPNGSRSAARREQRRHWVPDAR